MYSLLKLNNIARGISTSSINNFRITPVLSGEPLKRKKKLDPAIIRQREERKKRRIEKQIRRLEKCAQQLKPIDECEIPMEILNEKQIRLRKMPPLTVETLNERALLFKQWTVYRNKCQLDDIKMCDRILSSQQLALDQLKIESEVLYQAAIQPDEDMFPFKSKGLVETPPLENYEGPDGEYIDISKKWD